MVKNLTVIMLFFSVNICQGETGDIKSHYTSIAEKDCKVPSAKIKAHYEKGHLSVEECPGFGAWRVFYVDTGERSWLDLVSGSQVWSTHDEVLIKNQFGFFPNPGATIIEWRIDGKGHPVGLIFRITVQNPDRVSHKDSRLFVVRLKKNSAVFCGRAKTNQQARHLSARSNHCKIVLPGTEIRY